MLSPNYAIRTIVENIGDPLMMHIYGGIHEAHPGMWTDDDIRREVLAMVNREELRMKEDPVDHDWSYRKGSKWNRD